MKLHLNARFLAGFIVSMLILIALGFGAFMFIQRVIDLGGQGGKSQQLVFLSERIRSLVSERDRFIIQHAVYHDDASRQSAADAATTIRSKIQDMTSLAQENARLLKLVRKLDVHVAMGDSAKDAANFRPLAGDSVQYYVDAIQSLESNRRRERQSLATTQFYQFAFAFFGLLLLGLLTPLSLAYALNNNLKARTQSDEKLARASHSIYDLYENAPCGYFSFNSEGVFTRANRSFLTVLGYSKDELVDRRHFDQILLPEERDVYENVLAVLKKDRHINDLELRLLRKDHSIVFVSINAVAIMNEKDFIDSRCTLFDITALKNAEAEVRKMNRDLEAFSYSVSHDLRAPLRSVDNFARILKEDHGSRLDPEGNMLVDKVIRSADRMSHLIDDLLGFSKLGRKDVKRTEIDLDEFVKGISNELLEHEKGRSISIDAELLGKCQADQSMLHQVWVNLLSNALKYTRTRDITKINIGRKMDQGQEVFFVKDNGVGFDMNYSEKLFGVFQRLHKPEEFEGTGVGLALVKRIIERHNGKIWVEAEVNKGAHFYFTIPKG
jgi:PAS domain S-box-containing protein